MVCGRINKKEIVGNITAYDWTVFKNIRSLNPLGRDMKYTYILPDNKVVRLVCNNGYLGFNMFFNTILAKGVVDVGWCMFWFDIERGIACSHWRSEDVQENEEMIYKLMCFIYLSENEEILVQAGHRYGTQKTGKLVNSTSFPVTIVNSKWNITSVRTEGFDVSGHFRLQPTKDGPKVIFIQPFRKRGYIRRAKSIE